MAMPEIRARRFEQRAIVNAASRYRYDAVASALFEVYRSATNTSMASGLGPRASGLG